MKHTVALLFQLIPSGRHKLHFPFSDTRGEGSIAKVWHMRKVIVVPVVIGALGAVSANFKKYMYTHCRESEFGSHLENSIAGDNKDTKKSTDPVRRRNRETCNNNNNNNNNNNDNDNDNDSDSDNDNDNDNDSDSDSDSDNDNDNDNSNNNNNNDNDNDNDNHSNNNNNAFLAIRFTDIKASI